MNTTSNKPTIILASASIGRKDLLEKLKIPFDVLPSTIDEDAILHENAFEMIKLRAQAKATDVIKKLSNHQIRQLADQLTPTISGSTNNQIKNVTDPTSMNYEPPTNNYLVIATDSMAILRSEELQNGKTIVNNKVYGKVKNGNKEAQQMIRELMGKTHQFTSFTSIHLVKNGSITKSWEQQTISHVTLRTMNDQEIEEYTQRYDFSKFAACYTINITPWDWITKIDGSYTNVIGLPFEVILPILREAEIL